MNIVFIGMPGSGKSTIGVVCAKILGMDFLDADVFIQNNEKRKLQNIIDSDGVEKFLDIECENILKIDVDNTVIATGGSAVLRQNAMEKLKQNALTVFIDVPVNELEERIFNIKDRGVAKNGDETLSEIYNKRRPFYLKYADITVETKNTSLKDSISKTIDKIKEKISD